MLDIRVMLIVISWSGILLLAVGIGAGSRRANGLGTWNLALAAHTAAGVLWALRSFTPFWLGTLLSNMLMMASHGLYTAAVLEFFGARLPRRWVLGPVAFVGLTWLLLRDDYVGRVALAGVLFGVGELCPAVALYRRGRETRSPAQWLVMSAFGLYAMVFFSRFVVATFAPGSLGEHHSNTALQSVTYVVTSAFSLPTSVGFILMQRERAEQESERRKRELEALNGTLEGRVDAQVKEIVARSREVERLNAELRQQVQERSDELVRVLARVSRELGDEGPLAEGTRLGGRFVIDDVLGTGGMGAVYRALDTATGERVALKVIATTAVGELESVYRFLREAHASARVAHPAIVHARHVDVSEGRLFLVFELVDGVALDRLLREGRALPSGAVARFGAQLADALAAAHAAGVVHRDVKPGNVMVTRGRAGVRLLDFGISKLQDLAPSEAERTRTHAVLGTPAYMAPEQVTASSAVTDRCDVYAVGTILFELLAGRRPFVADTAMALAAMRVLGDAPSLRELAPQVPDALAALVQRCLARAPADRPSAAALAHALEDIAEALGDRGASLVDVTGEAPPARVHVSLMPTAQA